MKKLMIGVGLMAVAMGIGMTACDVVEAKGRGGRGGHGGHGGRGGHGNHGGGGKGTSVSTPAAVSAPAAGMADGGGLTTGTRGDGTSAEGLAAGGAGLMTAPQARTDADTKLAMREAGHAGLVTIDRINTDGSFTYSGYEWAVVAFAQQMKKLGYNMGWQGEDSTNFGSGLQTEAFGG